MEAYSVTLNHIDTTVNYISRWPGVQHIAGVAILTHFLEKLTQFDVDQQSVRSRPVRPKEMSASTWWIGLESDAARSTGCSVRKRLDWSTGISAVRNVAQDSDAWLNKYEMWIRELQCHDIAICLCNCWCAHHLHHYVIFEWRFHMLCLPGSKGDPLRDVCLAWKLFASLSVGLFKRWTVQHIDLTQMQTAECRPWAACQLAKTLKNDLKMVIVILKNG